MTAPTQATDAAPSSRAESKSPSAGRDHSPNAGLSAETARHTGHAGSAENPPSTPGVSPPAGKPQGKTGPNAAENCLRLALGCREAAKAIGLSERSFRRGISAGRVPQGLKVGGRRLWPLEGPNGLKAWLAAGCPPRRDWCHRQGK